MKKEFNYIFDENDIELLRKELPKSPCSQNIYCLEKKNSCCGCDKYFEYSKIIQKYKEAGILELSEKLQKVRNIKTKIGLLESQIEEYQKELKDIDKYMENILGDKYKEVL